ncbi:MAG: hypothetical protein IJ110_00430 [Lachnospiraceae bacterium]|nr:hypothetical protein [Lachnospiraceae bacterium]
MAFIILVLMVFFAVIYFMQQQKREKVNAGAQDKVIKKLLAHYKTLREHRDETGANAFVIGYAQQDRKGTLLDNPKALAVRILDEKGAKRDGAAALGMEVIETKGKYCYQFPVELENEVTSAELTAILARTKEKLEERYPDEFVGRAVSYLTVVIDGKKALDLLKENRIQS